MGRKRKTPVAEPVTEISMEEMVENTIGDVIASEGSYLSEEEYETNNFKAQYDKMYQITDKIVNKILANGGSLKQDSYVVREEFGEALAAGYRYLRYQGETSAKLRDAGHDNEQVDYELDMYKEFADVFMMTTSLCRHKGYKFNNRPFVVLRPILYTIEDYLRKVSEVLYRINYESINESYIYEFLEETFHMLLAKPGTLDAKIDKLYNKIFKIVE